MANNIEDIVEVNLLEAANAVVNDDRHPLIIKDYERKLSQM
jgi:hypothetical protein